MPDKVLLIYGDGLCRCGCGGGLAKPQFRFRLGHDFHLFNVLLRAYKESEGLTVQDPGSSKLRLCSPDYWAEFAFFPKGYRWWQLRSGLAQPADQDEMAGVEDPDLRTLDMGNHRDPGVTDRPAFEDSLAQDLKTVREVTAKAAASSGEDRHRIAELEALLAVTQEQLVEVRQALQNATVPLNFDQSGLASLTDAQALQAMHGRVRIAAQLLDNARYLGDSGEFWDLAVLMLPNEKNKVRIRAARALLGQENP
jgi:hypothetical protein